MSVKIVKRTNPDYCSNQKLGNLEKVCDLYSVAYMSNILVLCQGFSGQEFCTV